MTRPRVPGRQAGDAREKFAVRDTLIQLHDHLRWADQSLLAAIEAADQAPDEAIREFAHILGADEIWLARLEGRPATGPVWPNTSRLALRALATSVHEGFATYLAALPAEHLGQAVTYTTSDGRSFTTPVGEILLHVALHAQYHRGKVNLLLRAAGLTPAPVDFISFVRGAPAAVTRVDPPLRSGQG